MADRNRPKEEVLTKPFHRQWWFWVLLAVVAIGIIASLNRKRESLPDYDPVQSLAPQQTGAAESTTAPSASPTPEVEAGTGGEGLPAE